MSSVGGATKLYYVRSAYVYNITIHHSLAQLAHQFTLISAAAAPCVFAFSFALVLRSVSRDNQPYSQPRILSSLPPLGVFVRCI